MEQDASQISESGEKELSLEEALRLAIQFQQQRRLDDAEAIYEAILQVFPQQPDALHYLGVLHHQRGDQQKAIELIRRSIAIQPAYKDAYNNLGNIFKESGKLPEALAAYQKVIELDPDNGPAHNNLGIVFKATREIEKSLDHFRKAIELSPENATIYINLGNTLGQQKKLPEAVAAYRRALAIQPYNDDAYENLCRTLYIAEEHDEAKTVLDQWLEYDPDNPIALHTLAALTGTNVPERASDAYIQRTFAGFAGSFDRVLQELEYRAPELVAEAVKTGLSGGSHSRVEILDAGCGTGLCGPLLRPYASRLTGVDLSPAMIEKARGRKVYDELTAAELTEYLGQNPQRFDLIASADTLVYFGELADVFKVAAGALKPDGLLVFTLEKAQDKGIRGFTLNPHGRYSHTEDYVRNTLAEANLDPIAFENAVLRMERGDEVSGLVVTAKKYEEGRPVMAEGLK